MFSASQINHQHEDRFRSKSEPDHEACNTRAYDYEWTVNSCGIVWGEFHAQSWGRESGWSSNYYYVPSSLHFLLFWGDMWCGVGCIIALVSFPNYPFYPFESSDAFLDWAKAAQQTVPDNGTADNMLKGTDGGMTPTLSCVRESQRSTVQRCPMACFSLHRYKILKKRKML